MLSQIGQRSKNNLIYLDGEHIEKVLFRLQSSEICDWLGELRNMIIAPLAVLLTIFVGIIVFFCRRSSKYAQSQVTEVTRAYDVDSIGTFSDLKGDFSGKPSFKNAFECL